MPLAGWKMITSPGEGDLQYSVAKEEHAQREGEGDLSKKRGIGICLGC